MAKFRADHIGSLLRPKALLEARAAHERGEIGDGALKAVEDQAILDVLQLQKDAGIDVYSDGEFRRTSWVGPLYEHAASGLEQRERNNGYRPDWQGPGAVEANSELPIPVVVVADKLKMKGLMTAEESGFLGKHSPGPFKVTMPGPTIYMNLYDNEASRAPYPDRADYLDELIGLYKTEVEGQIGDGAAYVQLDSLRYMQVFTGRVEMTPGVSSAQVFEESLKADNAVLDHAKTFGATTAIHICRGNHRSAWAASGGYEPVAERLFSELRTDRFLLEFDDERSGGFEPLRFVPKGKTVVLGLITTKTPALEDKDMLRRRVDEAARFVALDDLAISPQCGFASTYLGNLLSVDEEKRKLELVAETARSIWG